MASIYERGPYQFQAVVRIKGARKQTKTFETREAANDWAAGVEADIRRSQFTDRRAAQTTTFDRILRNDVGTPGHSVRTAQQRWGGSHGEIA